MVGQPSRLTNNGDKRGRLSYHWLFHNNSITGQGNERRESGALGSRLSRLDVEWIIDHIGSYFHTSKDGLLTRKGEHRDLAIYLIKRYTNLSNRQIGEIFGDPSYSAVTKVEQRFRQKMEKETHLAVIHQLSRIIFYKPD